MRVDNCPKKLFICSQQCPLYPCWAFEEQTEKASKKSFDGWE